jgi:conjugative transfer signal peptidase TraF
MIKRILAAKNDRVSIAPEGVFINGAMVPNSAQVPTDTAGRLLPAYRAELSLDQSQVLLLSDYNGRSFDARYFGPVGAGQIRGVIAPILTW